MQKFIQNYAGSNSLSAPLMLPELMPRDPRMVANLNGFRKAPTGKLSIPSNHHDMIRELEGRKHFVIPVVMISGDIANGMVMQGSGGALLYPAKETEKTAFLWNGRPVVRDHNVLHGISSANDPEAYSRQRVGTVFNARFDKGRLVAEAWIDVERAKSVDQRIVDAIVNRQMVEVSTGLYADYVAGTGVVNGRTYNAVAINYRPDHLAILVDSVGACSIKDGCGLLRNSAAVRTGSLSAPLAMPSLG